MSLIKFGGGRNELWSTTQKKNCLLETDNYGAKYKISRNDFNDIMSNFRLAQYSKKDLRAVSIIIYAIFYTLNLCLPLFMTYGFQFDTSSQPWMIVENQLCNLAPTSRWMSLCVSGKAYLAYKYDYQRYYKHDSIALKKCCLSENFWVN